MGAHWVWSVKIQWIVVKVVLGWQSCRAEGVKAGQGLVSGEEVEAEVTIRGHEGVLNVVSFVSDPLLEHTLLWASAIRLDGSEALLEEVCLLGDISEEARHGGEADDRYCGRVSLKAVEDGSRGSKARGDRQVDSWQYVAWRQGTGTDGVSSGPLLRSEATQLCEEAWAGQPNTDKC